MAKNYRVGVATLSFQYPKIGLTGWEERSKEVEENGEISQSVNCSFLQLNQCVLVHSR